MRANPVGQALGPGGLGVGVVGGAEYGNEDLRFAYFTGDRVNDRNRGASVINEEFFAGPMRLAHHRFEVRLPLLVMKAELGVTVTIIRVCGPIFFPARALER
ncbi:MAG: hypothetical protein H0V18_02350 [Pyrinomonadaceae bacterium]|nr:hypothetical protein [Pyrinomonadaceae bacterium]